MKYRVVAIAVDQEGYVMTTRREEIIDTETNKVFADCRGPWDIEDHYEAYWNRLNDFWEHSFPEGKERVKVLLVEDVTTPEEKQQAVEARRAEKQAVKSRRAAAKVPSVWEFLAQLGE